MVFEVSYHSPNGFISPMLFDGLDALSLEDHLQASILQQQLRSSQLGQQGQGALQDGFGHLQTHGSLHRTFGWEKTEENGGKKMQHLAKTWHFVSNLLDILRGRKRARKT